MESSINHAFGWVGATHNLSISIHDLIGLPATMVLNIVDEQLNSINGYQDPPNLAVFLKHTTLIYVFYNPKYMLPNMIESLELYP